MFGQAHSCIWQGKSRSSGVQLSHGKRKKEKPFALRIKCESLASTNHLCLFTFLSSARSREMWRRIVHAFCAGWEKMRRGMSKNLSSSPGRSL